MNEFSFPAYLLPFSAFEVVEVTGAVREKMDADGARKHEGWTGESRPGWVVPVEVVRGTREKRLPSGKTLQVMDTETISVTIWSKSKPTVKMGDYVAFSGLAVGAMGGKIYVQALGVDVANPDALPPLELG